MSNPFLLLFESTTTDPYPISSPKPVSISDESSSTICKDIIEYVLLCTVDEQPSSSVIYLAELAVGLSENWDKNLIDQALFERLRMTDPSSQLVTPTIKKSTTRNDTNIITENRCLHYLAGCYQRLLRQRVNLNFFFFEFKDKILLLIGSFQIGIRRYSKIIY
jgi:hypothetical protein